MMFPFVCFVVVVGEVFRCAVEVTAVGRSFFVCDFVLMNVIVHSIFFLSTFNHYWNQRTVKIILKFCIEAAINGLRLLALVKELSLIKS